MTPTDKLRALLDERGIEWKSETNCDTYWYGQDRTFYKFTEYSDGATSFSTCQWNFTPKQALTTPIAAMVGNGTDLSKRLREVHGLHAFAELFGFDWSDKSDWDWHDVACAMADTIDATAGVGTCRLVDNDSGPDMHCTACGGEVDDEYWYFMDSWGYSRCPHCGARIIEEETE